MENRAKTRCSTFPSLLNDGGCAVLAVLAQLSCRCSHHRVRDSTCATLPNCALIYTVLMLPASPERLSPEFFTKLLSHHGAACNGVVVLQHARCGDGLASTADRVRLRLGFAGRAPVPEVVIFKTIFLHRYLRFGVSAVLLLSKLLRVIDAVPFLAAYARPLVFACINVYQRVFPHAPEAMYENEVRFYRSIRPELDVEIPRVYASVVDRRSAKFAIVMEDLALRSARFPNALEDVSLQHVRSLLGALAALHGQYWDTPRFATDLEWLPRTTSGGMFQVFDGIGLDLIRAQVQSNAFKKELLAPLGKSVEELWELNWLSQRIICSACVHTVLHGDAHVGNTYLLPGGGAGLLDFQLTVRGPWCHDFAYLVTTALSPEARRANQESLLRFYLEKLRDSGVTSAPSFERAWLSYRRASIWGLVIGWLITPPENYGLAITKANISRTVAAIDDLKCFEALQESC